MKKENLKFLVVAIVLAAVVAWTIYQDFGLEENWQCFNVQCSKFLTPEEWIDQNCFLVEGKQQCRVNVQGVDQLIPLEAIDTSKINVCLEFKCMQEVKVRTTDYKVNVTTQ